MYVYCDREDICKIEKEPWRLGYSIALKHLNSEEKMKSSKETVNIALLLIL